MGKINIIVRKSQVGWGNNKRGIILNYNINNNNNSINTNNTNNNSNNNNNNTNNNPTTHYSPTTVTVATYANPTQ